MIDLRHLLALLANRMPSQEIEACLAQSLLRRCSFSNACRPRLPTRLMVALMYLKHAFNQSKEDVIQRWGDTPTWQYYSCNEYFEDQGSCDLTQPRRFSKAVGDEEVEELHASTMQVAGTLKLIAKKDLTRVIVDFTVQEKAIAHPTDSKLLETARSKLVEVAKANAFELKKLTPRKFNCWARSLSLRPCPSIKRMHNVIKHQLIVVGRL